MQHPDWAANNEGHRIRRCKHTHIYEAALVYGLSAAITRAVWEMRDALASRGIKGVALNPHLTVAYLGWLPGRRIEALRPLFMDAVSNTCELQFDGYGIFNSDRLVTNIHLLVTRSSQICRAHEHALSVLGTLGESLQTKYAGARYCPHISIFDKLQIGQQPAIDALKRLPNFAGRTTAKDLHLMGRILIS